MALDLKATLRVDTTAFLKGMSGAAKAMTGVNKSAEALTGNIADAESGTSRLMSSLKGLVGAAAGLFALDKIKDFGVSAVEAAASSQAIEAQFDQVFGNVGNSAQKTIDGMGSDFGMVSNRLKPAFTQMTSMFKGLGLDTTDAMTQAKSAVTMAADAAAFYDKSYEDANAALNSFIKGNYEGGESIGLFANETQLASWASKNLNTDWKKLDEAGKQVARLRFAEAMQKSAGATGQAARESNSYENQLGNLRQTWTDLKAKFAAPVLQPVVNGLKSMADGLGKVDTEGILAKFTVFKTYMGDTFLPVLDDFKAGAVAVWGVFENSGGLDIAKQGLDGLKGGLQFLRDNSPIITAGVAGLLGAIAGFKILTGINTALGVMNGLMIAYRSGTLMTTLAQYGLNTAMLASPLTWVAVAIGAVIAAGVLLYKNWDTVKEKGLQLWDGMKKVWGGIEDGFTSAWDAVVGAAETALNGVIKQINKLIEKINKVPGVNIPVIAKVDWSQTEKPKKSKSDGSHAGGLSYVPRNGYLANLHRGERVLTAEENRNYSEGKGGNTYQFNVTIEGGNTKKEQAKELFTYFVSEIENAGKAGA